MKKHTTLKSKFNSAFSLVELLVVIAVIAVIAAIAIPNIAGTREAAIAGQQNYDAAQLASMQGKVAALTGQTPDAAALVAGVPVNITNLQTGAVSTVTFKLD
jgi:prepilin-type N-terminal cleavage/methylation domain-containing protein